jgi:hypothetical protein
MNRVAALFDLCSYTVDASRSLFQRARIPAKVMMDHVTAEAMKVDAFSHHVACHENFREERAVECEH